METGVRSTEILNSTPNEAVSLNCSGLVRKMNVGELTSQCRSNQVESTNQVERPTIQRKSKDFYRSLITFCQGIFQVQYICRKKMVAVQTACLQMYRHNYYLIPEQQSPESQREEASELRSCQKQQNTL